MDRSSIYQMITKFLTKGLSVKFIRQPLFFFFLLGISFISEAKQVDFFFNQTVLEDYFLELPMDDETLKAPGHQAAPVYCQQLTIENQGNKTLTECLPFNGQKPLYTLEELARQLAETEQPLLALYQFWIDAVRLSKEPIPVEDPLYLINFVGACDRQHYCSAFAKLCTQLGFSIRPVNIQGQEVYDVNSDEDCFFLNSLTQQIYLSLNNDTLVSSEEVMDDPFLGLRTKIDRLSDRIDFKKAWEMIGHFEIIDPYLKEILSGEEKQEEKSRAGFTLFPGEKLIYRHPVDQVDTQSCVVEHVVNLSMRRPKKLLSYSSPFPIKEIYNATNSTCYLLNQEILPGHTLTLESPVCFDLDIRLQDKKIRGEIHFFSACSKRAFPALYKGANSICLGKNASPAQALFTYQFNDKLENSALASVKIANTENLFNYCSPTFQLEASQEAPAEKIWWQISSKSDFGLIPSNFEQVETFISSVTLPTISETFFNANQKYFFRVKGYANGMWGAWSTPFEFTVKKPEPVRSPTFDKLDENTYELSWGGSETAETEMPEYWIFGSNSLDFIPSIYCDKQINAILNGEVIDEEDNQNLIAMTADTKYIVDGSLAYYRIITKQGEQFSVPSRLIHIYDQALTQKRNVLQIAKGDGEQKTLQRVPFPISYAWLRESESTTPMEIFQPAPRETIWAKIVTQLQAILSKQIMGNVGPYPYNPHVPTDIWAQMSPYLLPENHPAKPALDRMFSSTRVTLCPETFQAAGFKRYRPGRFSRIMASSHPDLKNYFIKAFADTELGIKSEWQKLAHRVEGARATRKCIVKNGFEKHFKVANKWIYPLPADPSPPTSPKFLRKNFILVAENMRILDHSANEKMYKKKMTHKLLRELFTIIQEVGLWDSVVAFNVPFCKDGKLAFVDTEYHHKWPVRFERMNRYFSKNDLPYWEELIRKNNAEQIVAPH